MANTELHLLFIYLFFCFSKKKNSWFIAMFLYSVLQRHDYVSTFPDILSYDPFNCWTLICCFSLNVVVQSLSRAQLFATPWTAAHQASLFFTISLSLLKLYVHWVNDATQPSHLLSPSSSPVLNLSLQGLLQWVGSSHQMAKVLELQHKSFQWIFRVDFL